MAKYAYPAIFEEDEGSIAVVFPDLKNCYTQGEDMVDALEMASDVLCGYSFSVFRQALPELCFLFFLRYEWKKLIFHMYFAL